MSAHYISLFSGAGGLDIGLERAGLRPLALCEIDDACCRTLRANQGRPSKDNSAYLDGARIITSDIRLLDPAALSNGATVDLVVGGPPCQAFSSSGKQLSLLDPRGELVMEFYRMIRGIKPRMFLFENVRGLVTARDRKGEPGGVIIELIRILQDIGYSCRAALLNAADYGAYQRRVRCFIVGSLRGAAPEFPEPRCQRTPNLFGSGWRTLGDFLTIHADKDEAEFVYPTDALAEQLNVIPNGCGIKSPGRTEATRPGGHWGYRQGTFIADLGLPARTVTGSSSQDWIRWGGLLRRLTLNEVKLLQGFPEDWIVKGSRAEQFKQVGNAVPTHFGEAIGEMILQHLKTFPSSQPVRLDLPESFKDYMLYTKKDQLRNGAARTVHRYFESAT